MRSTVEGVRRPAGERTVAIRAGRPHRCPHLHGRASAQKTFPTRSVYVLPRRMTDSPLRSDPNATLPAAPDPAGDAAVTASVTYDPEEYRWVPVRRRPRLDGWTEEKQRRFIEALADTGQVSLAAREVGMSRESAYKLRRAAHAAAFARAWDAARHHAGSFLEDVAFERAIEGVEHNVYNEYGEAICTRRAYNDRLLMFLLRHLKPERYARDALAGPVPAPPPVEATLGEMEPRLPAPPEQLLDPETLAQEIEIADIADGKLPHFFSEQRSPRSAERLKLEEQAAQEQRGKAAWEKLERKEGELSQQEWIDTCRYLDPAGRDEPSRKRYR